MYVSLMYRLRKEGLLLCNMSRRKLFGMPLVHLISNSTTCTPSCFTLLEKNYLSKSKIFELQNYCFLLPAWFPTTLDWRQISVTGKSFKILGSMSSSYEGFKFRQFFSKHIIIALRLNCTLIPQLAALMLSRITWTLLKLLVSFHYYYYCCY